MIRSSSILAANSPQTPNGTSFDASSILGLTGQGSMLKDQTQDEIAKRRKMLGLEQGNPNLYGDTTSAADMIFGTTR